MLFGVQFGFATARTATGVISDEMLLVTGPLTGIDALTAAADGTGSCLASTAPGWASGLRAVLEGLWTTAAAAGPKSIARQVMDARISWLGLMEWGEWTKIPDQEGGRSKSTIRGCLEFSITRRRKEMLLPSSAARGIPYMTCSMVVETQKIPSRTLSSQKMVCAATWADRRFQDGSA